MPELHPWRTFSIFISSTFADMQAERDYLKQIIFPRIEEELQKRRIKLEIVDLRWGVDTTSIEQEDEREATVLKVCLDEIKRCRPFFIGLLGDRYGWVPPEEQIKKAVIGEDLVISQKGKSVTALEIEFGVFASKEQLNRSVFYFREPLSYEDIPLQKVAMYSDEFSLELDETEKRERKAALENLKTSIREHYEKKKRPDKVKTYRVSWNDDRGKVSGLETWGEMVYQDVIEECKLHAEATWGQVPKNWQEQELALLDTFIESHTTTFSGRKELLKEIILHLLSKNRNDWGMVLTGESGSGKSAVFAMVKKAMDLEDCFVLAHSAGLSHRAKNVLDLLQIWNKLLSDWLEIEEKSGELPKDIERFELYPEGIKQKVPGLEIEKIQDRFRELLFIAAERKPVVILLDALDRFEPTDRARYITWLPTVVSENIRMLCTAITGTEEKAVAYHSELFAKSIDHFTEAEAKEMLNMLCKRQHKDIPDKVEMIILDKVREDRLHAASSPLWLSLAVNILMALDHDDFEKMQQIDGRGDHQIESYMVGMATKFPPLPGALFLDLAEKAAGVFGRAFTHAVFDYIACSRNGLREKDLVALLQLEKIDWDALLFANLRRWFKAHLVLQGEELQWNLAHSILRAALVQHAGETQQKNLHGYIADYLLTLVSDPLKDTDTIYHLLQAGKLKEAATYYGGNLTAEEKAGATIVLAETITTVEKGTEIVGSLPTSVADQHEVFHGLLKRYIYDLNVFLAIEGNLNPRLNLLDTLGGVLKKAYGTDIPDEYFGQDIAALNEKLGEIYQAIGKFDQALEYFNNYNNLTKDLYESNPKNESPKKGLAISYSKLGEIYQVLGKLDQALKYFNYYNQLSKELKESNPKNENLKDGLAISYSKLGEIYQAIGKFDQALEYFNKEVLLFEELYESNPKNESFKYSLAVSYEKLGEIYQDLGNFDQGLEYYNYYNQLSKELYESNPKNESLKNGLAISYAKLGDIYLDLGKFDQALEHYNYYNQLSKKLHESNPKNESLKNHLAISYSRLGEIYQDSGKFDQALEYYKLSGDLVKELYQSNPKNESLKNGLAISYEKLGRIYQAIGKFDQALEYYTLRGDLGKELYENNPKNENLKNGLAISYSILGEIYQAIGKFDQALEYYKLRSDLGKELCESNPKNESLKNGLAISYSKLGEIYQAIGKFDQALEYFNNGALLFEKLYESNPKNESLKNGLAISYQKLGEIYQAIGKFDQALEYFNNFNQLSKELHKSNPKNENLKNHLAISYQKLGEIYQTLCKFDQALEYFNNCHQLKKELFESNPSNIRIIEGRGISFYKLAMVYKAKGDHKSGKENFLQWQNIISHLAKNLPQVPRYQEWNLLEYD